MSAQPAFPLDRQKDLEDVGEMIENAIEKPETRESKRVGEGGLGRPLNARERAFVRLAAGRAFTGITYKEAYRQAGYAGSNKGGPQRLLRNPRILHEIKMFERRLSGDAGARLRAILDRQMATALCDPSEFYELDENECLVLNEDGVPRLRKTIGREQLLAISEVSISDKGASFRVDIAGAQKALRDFYDDRPPRPRTVRLEGPAGGAVEVVHGLAERLNAAKKRLNQNEPLLGGYKSETG